MGRDGIINVRSSIVILHVGWDLFISIWVEVGDVMSDVLDINQQAFVLLPHAQEGWPARRNITIPSASFEGIQISASGVV